MKVQGWFDGRTTRLRLQWTSGKTTEKWKVPGASGVTMILEQSPEDGTISVADSRFHEADVQKFGSTPFADLFWMQPSHYVGPRYFQGQPSYFYRAAGLQRTSHAWDTLVSAAMSVWIDPASRLPRAATDENSLWLYTFGSAPAAGSLVLSPLFAAAQQQAERRYQKLIGRFKAVKP
ncbi:hypothetical protein DB346_20895 [Verrucomicrobia bacterium LW23]|nr:hypothetical protein DB346_20895 [Verrucomicrobia bacterium LW23]